MLHPSSFTAYAFTEKNTPLKKLSIPWADPEQNQVVLKVKACGVCAGDTVPQLQAWPVALPRIPGHEFVGEIVAVGENETKFNIGEIVGGGWHAGHCSDCAQCRVGKFIGCTSRMAHGITHDGGYAEYVTIRREAVCRIPEGMAPEIAGPLLCAGVTMYNSLRNVDVRAGDIVAIHGIGGLGHLGIQFAAKMGYRAVALSSGPAKREDCMSFGAFAYLDASEVDQSAELQKMGGAKVLMLCAPTANVSGFINGMAYDGTLLVLADTGADTPINLFSLVDKRITIRGWPAGSTQDLEDCLAFAQHFGIKPLVQTFPLSQAQDAYDHRSSARYRAVIMPEM